MQPYAVKFNYIDIDVVKKGNKNIFRGVFLRLPAY